MNSYIENTLNTVKSLLLENFAEKLVLVIKEDDRLVERFVFSFNSFYKHSPRYFILLQKKKTKMHIFIQNYDILILLMQWESYVEYFSTQTASKSYMADNKS